MGLIVQKFGGSSVRDTERIFNVARIIEEKHREGNRIAVVVSAQGDTTDDLIEKAAEITDRPSRREMDMLLSTGEQISASLLAMALGKLGIPAISLTGWQAGFLTDSSYGLARIRKVAPERMSAELEKNHVVIVTGFQGVNRYDDITTLGRGGSDTSAVAIAAVLHADLCQIYTDVDGVYTADPRKVKTAKKLSEISYDEMLELASLGAQVLHNRSVEMAKKFGVKLEVLSSLEHGSGTVIKENTKMEKMLITGVAKDSDIARIAVIGLADRPGIAFKVFSLMAAAKVNVDIILQSIGRGGTKDISFTIPKSSLPEALEILKKNCEELGADEILHDENVAKISVVGAGMQSNPGVASTMFRALYDCGINIQMISTSEIKISVLLDKKDADQAVSAVHDAFLA